ncbi:MAG: glycosyltransferase family 2 protein [Lachnospiraceae bacterium]|nr:glycosyltransferase family 2 protein [Lachnospiraceae bacterium]
MEKFGKGNGIMISIVLPVYNGERYICQSIDSIINQSWQDWELIIVNDSSIDRTGEIAEEYAKKDKRIKVIHNEKNKKLPESLNIGFENASGSYYTWTSDDNAYREDALEIMCNALERDADTDIVFCNYTIIDSDDYIICDMEAGPAEELPLENTIGACFLYRREVHEGLSGYDAGKFLVEDYDFWLRAYWKYRFCHLEENPYYYRVHAFSLTSERKKEVSNASKVLRREHIDKIKDANLRERVRRSLEELSE